MRKKQNTVVVGVFADRAHAMQAVDELHRAGFTEEQIGVAARDMDTKAVKGKGKKAKSDETYAEEGAVAGALTGAGAGALWAIGIAAGVLPAIGPVIAGGIFASILASAATGAAVGGLAGSLIGLGVPEEEAEFYEGELKAGRTIVTVQANGRTAEARAILTRHGAYDMRMALDQAAAEGGSMQVREEELRVHKHPVETGEVRLRKEVHTEHKVLEVPVEKEEVVVERRPASGRQASAHPIEEGEEVRIPVREEHVHVEKTPVVKEEVSVRKRKVKGTEHVAGTVRKEEVHVEEEGDVEVRGSTTRKKRT